MRERPAPDRGAAGWDGDGLLQVVQREGVSFSGIVFTRNRRTMVSATRRGVLRVHEAFRGAPPHVIRAIGRFFASRRRASRVAAATVIREFVTATIDAHPVARRKASPPDPADLPHLERLQREFVAVNDRFFGGSLPEVPIRLSGRMRRRNGHFSAHPPEIAIARALCVHAEAGEAERTLRHEMIHVWQWATGAPLGHGPEFRGWARILDVPPRATRTVPSIAAPCSTP